MKKFEYKIFKLKKSTWGTVDYDSTELYFNKLGQEGWELATYSENSPTNETISIFKREILA